MQDINLTTEADAPLQYPESAVAVVGVACRFAGADSLEELWHVLETGTTHFNDVPEHRFPSFRFERRSAKHAFQASCINDLDAFDHKFFNVTSREASFRDPQQRLALEVTYQALESAGYFMRERSEQQRDVGCYIATAMNEYHENVVTHAPSAYSLIGSIRPFIAGQVSHFFGFTGPAVMLDAACAASGAAINIACRAVASGECASAIAGATNIFISPETFQDLASGHFTSPTGPSKPFDADADGYGRGEGVAAVVLKKLSDALKDGDVIKGVILATAVNQCANDCPITVPHGPTQSVLYRKALRTAQLSPSQIGYVEAHGTGTRVGDPIEVESIRSVFGNPSLHNSQQRVYLGSLKSNIGHAEAASGLSSLIKVILMIEKAMIPPQALFNRLHPDIPPLEPYGLKIATKNIPWPAKNRVACVNNYGASGTNAVMIVSQPPSPPSAEPREPVSRVDTYPISITAFSHTSLKSYCSALLKFTDRPDANDDLALDIAFHLSRRRNPDLNLSTTSRISSLGELRHILLSTMANTNEAAEHDSRSIVLFFGGQSGKSPSVSPVLFNCSALLRKHLYACDTILKSIDGQSMFPTVLEPDGFDNTVLEHSKLFSVQYASAKAWMDSGLRPSRLIGHSFGQLTALCVSGALSLQEALGLIIGRARLIDERWSPDPGSMIAVEASRGELSDLMLQHRDSALEIACHNGVRSFVLAGPTPAIEKIETSLKNSVKLHRFKRLQVPNAFHSALAEPIIEPLRRIIEQMNLQEPTTPIETCSSDSTWPSITPSLIASHVRDPVYFHQAVQRIAKQLGPAIWMEAGSGNNAILLRRALEPHASGHTIKAFKIASPSAVEQLADQTVDLWRSNSKVQFWCFHPDQHYQYAKLNLPPYQFDKTRHWLDWRDISVPRPATKHSFVPEKNPSLRFLRNFEAGSEFEINTRFETWRAASAESRVLDASICPISVLLSLLSDAITTIQGGSSARIHRIQQMQLSALMPADMNDQLILVISKGDSPRLWTFRLTKGSNSKYEFMRGAAFVSTDEPQSDFVRFERLLDMTRVEQLECDPDADSIRGRGVYKLCAEVLQFPKCNEVVKSLFFRGNEAAALLTGLHMSSHAVLESLIQVPLICLNGLHERDKNHLFVNTAIGDWQSKANPLLHADKLASYWIYLKFFGLGEQEVTCDIYMIDQQSRQICGIVLDVGFACKDSESIRRHLHSDMSGVTSNADSREDVSPEAAPFGTIAAQKPSIPLLLPMSSNSRVASRKSDDASDDASNDASDNTSDDTSDDFSDNMQPLLDVLQRIADVDVDKLHGDTLITDLGIDSLMGMEVAEEVNKVFGVDLEMAELLTADDVRALWRLIARRADGLAYHSIARSRTRTSIASGSAGPDSRPDKGIPNNHQKPMESRSLIDLNSAYNAIDNIRTDFDVLAREAGCDDFWSEVHPAQMRLIQAYCVEAFAKLGCDLASLAEGEKIKKISHIPSSDKMMQQVMLILQDVGLVTKHDTEWLRSSKRMLLHSSSVDEFDLIQSRFPKWAPEHELLHIAGSNLAGFFDGSQDPLKLLFGTSERRKLMADQYLMAPIQSTVSRQLSRFISKCFADHKTGGPLQILEIGGGTCGTTIHALEAFAKIGGPVVYTFTDISSSFISAAKVKLKAYDWVRYQTVDITQTPDTHLRGSFDMILATNVIHATPSVEKSASNARQMLKKGGIFALVEYTDAYAAIDIVFGQLEGWWLFNDGRTHATMNTDQWRLTLKSAGFGKVDWTGSETRESQILRIILAS